MAEVNARIVFPSRIIQKAIGSVEIDAFMDEEHSQSGSITRYPVEQGADISDHIILDPDTLSIKGIMGPSKLVGGETNQNRTRDAYNDLTQLRLSKQLVTVVTGLRVYSDMFISDFNVPRNASNGGSLEFSMKMQQARVVSSQVVQIPNTQIEDTELQAQGEADVGKASSGQTQSQKEEGSNFLAQIEAEVDALLIGVGLEPPPL